MDQTRRHYLAALASIPLAGCTGRSASNRDNTTREATSTTTTTTQTETSTSSSTPVGELLSADWTRLEDYTGFRVDYRLDAYGTIILHGPGGDILQETKAGPDQSSVALPVPRPKGGEYRVVMLQNDTVVDETTRTFEGPDLEVASMTPELTDRGLEAVQVTLENTGDMHSVVGGLEFSFAGENATKHFGYFYVQPGGRHVGTITPAIPIWPTEPGTYPIEVTATTGNGAITATKHPDIKAAQLVIQNIDDEWTNSALNSVTVTLENSGDISTTAAVRVLHDGDVLAENESVQLPPKTTTEVSLGAIRIYNADTAGEKTFTVVVESEASRLEESFSHTVA